MYDSSRSSGHNSSSTCGYPSSTSPSSCFPRKKCEDTCDSSAITISVSPDTPLFPCCSESDSCTKRSSCGSSCNCSESYCSCTCSGESSNTKTDDTEHRLFKVSFLSLNDGSRCFVVNGHRRPILRLKEGVKYHFVICDVEEGHKFLLTNNPIGKFPGLPLKTIRGGFSGGNGSFVFTPDCNTPRIFAYQSNRLAFAGNYVTVDASE